MKKCGFGAALPRLSAVALPLALMVSLAGCVSDQPAGSAGASAAAPTFTAARGATRPPGGPNLAAEDICVKAVQQQTNAEGVGVLASEVASGEAQSGDVQPGGTVVMLNFPAARAPWRCVTNADGRVTEVGVTSG